MNFWIGYLTGLACAFLICCFGISESTSTEKEVYQGKTTLEYKTYKIVDGEVVDSCCVVYKKK